MASRPARTAPQAGVPPPVLAAPAPAAEPGITQDHTLHAPEWMHPIAPPAALPRADEGGLEIPIHQPAPPAGLPVAGSLAATGTIQIGVKSGAYRPSRPDPTGRVWQLAPPAPVPPARPVTEP